MSLRAQLRAALVLFHCVGISLSALPNPVDGLNKKNWSDPTVQGEFQRYAGWLGMESAELQDRAYEAAKQAVAVRETILAPFDDWLGFWGVRQSWRMFVAPHRFPTRVEIAGKGAGDWEVVFFEADPGHQWNGRALRTEPYKGLLFRWGWTSYARYYDRGCRALARRLRAERPDFSQVRCRYWKTRSVSPEEARAGLVPPGEWRGTIVVAP